VVQVFTACLEALVEGVILSRRNYLFGEATFADVTDRGRNVMRHRVGKQLAVADTGHSQLTFLVGRDEYRRCHERPEVIAFTRLIGTDPRTRRK